MMVAGTARNAATGFAGAGATAGATAEGATAANVLNRVVGCVSIWLVLMPGASGSVRSTVAVARVVFAANVLICGDKSGATAGFASIDGVIDENCCGGGAGGDEIPDGGAAGVVGAVDVVAVAVTSGRGVVSVEVCAPPELLTTTPPATTEVVAVVPLGGVSAPLDGVEPCADGVLAVLPAIVDGVGAVAVPVGESVSALPPEAVDPVDPAELVAPVLSVPTSPVAHAMPGVATAIPTPSATANAPTRPTYIA
jgi:hypothetical protein